MAAVKYEPDADLANADWPKVVDDSMAAVGVPEVEEPVDEESRVKAAEEGRPRA